MKSVDGGERSITMVSYLLSLWDAIECPFGVMDEADVFMDAANREMTMRLLVQMTRRQLGFQSVFLVPDASNVPTGDDDVTMFEMPAVER